MKQSIFILTTFAIMFAFIAQSCDSSSNEMQRAETDVIEAERDLEIAQSEIEADVRIYRQEMASEIRENNLEIAEIKEQIQHEEADVKAANEVRIAELERTNDSLKREIDNYSVTDRDNWNSFKDQFGSNMNDLSNSLDNFFSNTTTTSRN